MKNSWIKIDRNILLTDQMFHREFLQASLCCKLLEDDFFVFCIFERFLIITNCRVQIIFAFGLKQAQTVRMTLNKGSGQEFKNRNPFLFVHRDAHCAFVSFGLVRNAGSPQASMQQDSSASRNGLISPAVELASSPLTAATNNEILNFI